MKTVTMYQTDFGAVRMGKYARSLPVRKNGDFDRRYKRVRVFISALNTEAARVYQSSRTGFLQSFGHVEPTHG